MAQMVRREYSPRQHVVIAKRARSAGPTPMHETKRPTMRSSLTSSSQVNRASRGRSAARWVSGAEQTPPCRGQTSRVFTTRDRWPNSHRLGEPIRKRTVQLFLREHARVHGRSSWDRRSLSLLFFLFFLFFPLLFSFCYLYISSLYSSCRVLSDKCDFAIKAFPISKADI